jgi:WD40 repeat protein
MLASASYDNTVKLWRRNGELLRTLKGHSDSVAHAFVLVPLVKFWQQPLGTTEYNSGDLTTR